VPTGDPLVDAVGPAAYADRADVPDRTFHGEDKIVPLRYAKGFYLEARDPDPRGLKVKACDGEIAGTIVEVWVDRSEPQVRYYEVQLAGSGEIVLLPVTFVQWPGFGFSKTDHVLVKSITAVQFRNVPRTKSPMQITFLEEDQICAYYAGGHLYANAKRAEPYL
jgi:photosynthetic reaction center H subunit